MLTKVQPRALIVDDEAPAREELRYLLQELGADRGGTPVQVVGEATNGEEALVLLRSLEYDLVFLDIRMPGLGGLEVARELGALPRRPQVVFTTAYPDHAVDAFDLAAADYLVKPFDADRLRRAVDRALSTGAERGDDGAGTRRNGEPEARAGSGGPPAQRAVAPNPGPNGGRSALAAGAPTAYAAPRPEGPPATPQSHHHLSCRLLL